MTNSPPETISATPISFESGTMGSSCWPFSVRHVNICNASVEISLTFDYNSKLVSDECSVFHRYLTGLSFILKISPALFKINIVKCTAGLNKIIAFRLVVAKVLSNVPPPVAFLFNWIGFCLSFCLTNTIAGRYGAICGFGLSLIKWILIVRVRTHVTVFQTGLRQS